MIFDVENVSNIITALATILAAAIAFYGVREWKRQMKGKTDYEIARRYLKAALVLRDALEYVRNPFISSSEMQKSLKEQGLDPEEYRDNIKTNQAVYSERWKKVQVASTNLEAELLEAEVSWGSEATKAANALNASVRQLSIALSLYINGQRQKIQDELIYNQGTLEKPDVFSEKVSKAVVEIREFLRPHLL